MNSATTEESFMNTQLTGRFGIKNERDCLERNFCRVMSLKLQCASESAGLVW